MLREKPSLWNFLVVSNPGIKLVYAIPVLVVMIVIAGRELFIAFKQGDVYSLAIGLISLVCLLIGVDFVYRYSIKQYKTLNNVFINGVEIPGTIIDLHFGQKVGYVIYEYAYQDCKYRSSDRIQQSGKAEELHIGQKVYLYVNRTNPSRAFIRDLYL